MKARGLDSLQYLVVGRVVSQCISKVFKCLLVNAELGEKVNQRITLGGDSSLANHTPNSDTHAFWLSWQKKRATDTSLKKKLKTPIFVDLSLKVKVSMRQSRLWCTPVFHNNASLAGNGPVSLNPWWGGGAASKPKLGMSRVKLLIPFQEKQKMERPPQRQSGGGGGTAEQRTGGAWSG